jgi:hypothetical protein
VFALACEQPKATFTLQLESCIEGAQSMKLDIATSPSIAFASIASTSSNVNDAVIESTAPGQFTVVAHFNSLALHEVVELTLECGTLGSPPQEAAVSNVVFYSTPEPGSEDPCPPSGTPTVTVLDAICGPTIELSNTHNPAPIYVPLVQLATAPEALAESHLHWGDAELEALPWCTQFTSEFVLINPFTDVFSVCLNDANAVCGSATAAAQDGPEPGAVLLRFDSLYNGLHHRGIVQIDLFTGHTLQTEATSWGRVKALYRN